ncbi:MAG TPA: hypothetical protein VL486_13955 [Verrucomicrobiae bacterium]|nr:hypothetical protein [Verrucomicrobiae bacterium]
MTQEIPKHPTDPDQTLKAVLDDIKFRNSNGRILVDYEINTDKVILTYEPKGD